MKNIINKTIAIIKEDYPAVYKMQGAESLDAKINSLVNDEIIPLFKLDESLINYLVICIRYEINYQYLLQDNFLASILYNSELHESERLYLIDEKLYYS